MIVLLKSVAASHPLMSSSHILHYTVARYEVALLSCTSSLLGAPLYYYFIIIIINIFLQ